MAETLLRAVMDSFGALLGERAFAQVHYFSYPEHFGNEILVYESPVLGLKFIKDRLVMSVEVAPAHSTLWFPLPPLLEFLALRAPVHALDPDPGLEEQAEVLMREFDSIAATLQEPKLAVTVDSFPAFMKARANQLFPGLSRDKSH